MDHSQGTWSAQPPAPDKSCELYIRDSPFRSIAIVSSTHALILRYSSSSGEFAPNGSHNSLPSVRSRGGSGDSVVDKCMVEFTPVTEKLMKDYRTLSPRPIYGTLGLISVNGEVFLSVIAHATRAATVRPGETVERILGVTFYCLSSSDYDDVVPLESLETEMSSDASSVYSGSTTYGQGLSRREVAMEHPCHELRKLLSNGSFYYSTDFDITNRLQERPINSSSFDIDKFDHTFLWNSYMITPLAQFRSRLMPQEREALDASRMLTSAIRGFCKTMVIPQSASPLKSARSSGKASSLTLISRLSCFRAGTRFNARGVDDDGHVANFVESETTFWSPAGLVFSYTQVRGSVPIFWEQAADLIPGRQKITVIRGPDATQPTLNKHFDDLEQTYGAVHVINLLSATKPGEVEISRGYKTGIRNCPLSRPHEGESMDHVLLRATHYDFHAETKGPAGYEAAREIRRYIEDSVDGFAYFLAEEADDPSQDPRSHGNPRLIVVLQQEGVFRTNCLDCLDRTNLIQTLISQMAMEAFLGHRGQRASSDFWMRHSTLWADNGDSLSKIYAGTGALKSSFTRHGKMSLAGAVADMRKSVQRIYHNNFIDPSRQVTIDMLLGRLIGQAAVHLFDPISDHVSVELNRRNDEFTSFESISMWVGTFNLNGRTDGIREDLSPWLFPPPIEHELPDIYVVAFQEIVELSPQQIMNSDPTRKKGWEEKLQKALNDRQRELGGENYVLLRSGQLVGAALCIFVKASLLPNIKNVEGSVKKTGMSGMAGNKGAVAIRMNYANTQICFVTAHLAAGFGNYDERNRDFSTIHHGLRFQRNRSIDDHDVVIWLGDFNYRIGLANETARALVKRRDVQTLYENDQLNLQMVAGLAFPFYSEARITFMPTYRFDVGSDTYDSSEKARVPAWTDRILRKGTNLRQLSYDSAPLRFSDHRPVYATFDCTVSIVDEAHREAISQELYARRKAELGDTTANVAEGEDTDDDDLIGYDAIEPGLPPASSDRNRWWLDNKQPARAQIPIPSSRNGQPVALNPNRPSNPFRITEEPDWVSVSRASPGVSSLSSSPYEKIPMPKHLETANNASAGRRLPPPYDPASLPANVGPMKNIDPVPRKAVGSGSEPPAPPPPRRGGTSTGTPTGSGASGIRRTQTQPLTGTRRPESAASQASNTSDISLAAKGAKSPPPIVRKPAHLSASSSPASQRTIGSNSGEPPLPVRSNTGSTISSQLSRGGSLNRKPLAAGGSSTQSEDAPSRPNRPAAGAGGRVDLLDSLDESTESVGGWETLQPST